MPSSLKPEHPQDRNPSASRPHRQSQSGLPLPLQSIPKSLLSNYFTSKVQIDLVSCVLAHLSVHFQPSKWVASHGITVTRSMVVTSCTISPKNGFRKMARSRRGRPWLSWSKILQASTPLQVTDRQNIEVAREPIQ